MDGVTRVESPPPLPRRPRDGHKGTFGKVLVVAGSRGMSGAAVLCGMAALRGGAGLVQVATPANVQDVVAAGCPCFTTFGIRLHADGTCADGVAADLLELAESADVVAIGPGLGQRPCAKAMIRAILTGLPDKPVVVDADALNALAPLADDFLNRPAPLILTPHPGEFARLAEQPVPAETEREDAAVAFARKVGGVLVLKGAGTVVTDGARVYRNATGNPGMATGGTGDVLTGLVAALVGQGPSAFDAAALGAWVHGRAGDRAAEAIGQTSLTATDVLEYIPVVFRELESTTAE